MVPRKILVIDDERVQAEALAKTISEAIPHSSVIFASSKEEIENVVVDKFYNLAILDIRMDGYDFDGISLAKKILEINPFTKILFVSRFISEYMPALAPLLQHGNILGFSEKKTDYESWKIELGQIINEYYESLDSNPQQINSAMMNLYSDAKDEEDTYRKGKKFEDFVALLFQYIGFSEILKRVIDKSRNETDLIIRNDIDDKFLSKFGKYILVECKNKPSTPIDKNDFIVFLSKLSATNGLAEMGFLMTTSSFTKTAYLEALRTSKETRKIIFIDNPLIMELIDSSDPREALKKIIDTQVKDN